MNKQKLVKILRISLVSGIPVAALLQELAFLLSYDVGANYFVANAPLFTVANVFIAVLFAIAILCALIDEKKHSVASPFGKQIWVAIPAAIGFSIGGVFLAIDFFQNGSRLSLVAAVFLLLSTVHVLLSETDRKNKFLGFFPPIACALLVCILYFDTSLEMNAPLKVAVQCALLPLMLYFTTELRYLLGRELPRLYCALSLGSLAASALCILTVPVASIMGRFENAYCLIASLAVIGINATVALRQWRYLQTPEPIESPSHDENDTKETDAQ